MLILALGIIAQALISALSLMALKDNLIQDRRVEMKHIVEAASATIDSYQKKVEAGALTEEAAKEGAKAAIRAMRFDNGNYLFIWDFDGRSIAHGGNPKLEGTVFLGDEARAKNPMVNFMVARLVDAGKSGEGYAYYKIPKSGQTEPLDKIAYAKTFQPWGWIVGAGAYVDDIDRVFAAEEHKQFAITAVLMLVAAALSLVLARDLSRAIKELTEDISSVSRGEFDRVIQSTARRDEMGTLARGLSVLRDASREAERMKAEQAEAERGAATAKREAFEALARQFETQVRGAAEAVVSHASEVGQDAGRVREVVSASDREARLVSERSKLTAAAVRHATDSATTVIGIVTTIGGRVDASAASAQSARERAQTASAKITEMEAASRKINDVVGLIGSVAAQTNLLALNATIEAARAGEAGKGFAVVAGEVKALANQTARATSDITQQVGAMQTMTGEAVSAILSVAAAIGEVDEAVKAIAHDLTSQEEAVRQISADISAAANDSDQALRSLDNVTRSTAAADGTAAALASRVENLNHVAGTLRAEVDQFLRRITS